jgi:hypothetical protein
MGIKFARINFAGTHERCFQRSKGRLIYYLSLQNSKKSISTIISSKIMAFIFSSYACLESSKVTSSWLLSIGGFRRKSQRDA